MTRLLIVASKSVLLIVICSCVLVLVAWVSGRLLSDRFGWSQWLAWIPTLAAIPAATIGLITTALWPRKRWMLLAWCVSIVAVVGYFSLIEFRMFRRATADPAGLRIVHWNASPVGRDGQPYKDAIIQADGDVTILTDAWRIAYWKRLQDWLGDDSPRSFRSHPFTILSRLPIMQHRTLVAEDEIYVLYLKLDATETLGRPMVIYAVDMPSDLNLSRAELARRTRRMIDNADAPPPDLVLGDFNITRGAFSLQMLFPRYEHAYDQAGRGYSATFRRDRPLYHIDHMLLGESLRATSYAITDPGVGRHRIQSVTIVNAPE